MINIFTYLDDFNLELIKNTEIASSLDFGVNIGFISGKMPLKIYWDIAHLYDSILPFSNTFPMSNAIGIVDCGAGEPGSFNCLSAFDYEPLKMTNQPNP